MPLPLLSPFTTLLSALSRDAFLLFVARTIRLVAYGALSVVLVFYLAESGLTERRIGTLLSLTLAGDAIISVILATRADRWGRRRVLLAGAWLMTLAGFFFALPGLPFGLMLLAGTLGVISPTGSEVGPFLAVEQSALSQLAASERRTAIFGWYTLAGSLATAGGCLLAGLATQSRSAFHLSEFQVQRAIIVLYGFGGTALLCVFFLLSGAVEPSAGLRRAAPVDPLHALLGLHSSRKIVLRLSALFSLDAFAGGFIVQSLMAYWFHVRYGADISSLGALFFGANVLAGFSALVATRVAARVGLVRTMVFTHLPSNVLLILVPFMPNFALAATILLVRYSISQMDVPARQSYTMAVVAPDERSAAAAITGLARTVGAALAPALAAPLLARPSLLAAPFFIAGTLKIVYDLLLWRLFDSVSPAEELQVA
jgi:MFS family permease